MIFNQNLHLILSLINLLLRFILNLLLKIFLI